MECSGHMSTSGSAAPGSATGGQLLHLGPGGTTQLQLGEGIPKAAFCVPPSLPFTCSHSSRFWALSSVSGAFTQWKKPKLSPSSMLEGNLNPHRARMYVPFPSLCCLVCVESWISPAYLQELMAYSSKGHGKGVLLWLLLLSSVSAGDRQLQRKYSVLQQ